MLEVGAKAVLEAVVLDSAGRVLDTVVVFYSLSRQSAGASVGFWDLESGLEVAREDTFRRLPHGVVSTPDGAFSFVSLEGVGGEHGTVEVYDNRKLKRVGSVDLDKQAGGLAYWAGPSRRPD